MNKMEDEYPNVVGSLRSTTDNDQRTVTFPKSTMVVEMHRNLLKMTSDVMTMLKGTFNKFKKQNSTDRS